MHLLRGYTKKARSNLLGHVLIIIWHVSYKYSKKEIRINAPPMTILKHDPLSWYSDNPMVYNASWEI